MGMNGFHTFPRVHI